MIIKADSRGRIALSKLGGGYSKKDLCEVGTPHSEWEVTVQQGQVMMRPYLEPEVEDKTRWQKWGRLDPDLIGQVIYVDYDSLGTPGLPAVRGHTPSGLVGVLEWYTTGDLGSDVIKVKISGCNAIEFKNYGLFWVKS